MTASTIHRALKKERESWTGEQARLVGEQQKLASERDQAIAEANRLLANNSDVSSEQSEWSRQRQSLMAERDQLVAERQAQRTEIEKVRESVNTHIYKGDIHRFLSRPILLHLTAPTNNIRYLVCIYWSLCVVVCTCQVAQERDGLQQSLAELQRQRQDVMGQSREIGAKYDTIQEQVSSRLPPMWEWR